MYVEFQNSKNDLTKFLKSYYFKKELPKRLLLILIASFIIGSGKENYQSFNLSTFILKTTLAFVTLFILFLIIPYFISLKRYGNPTLLDQSTQLKKILLNNDGVDIITSKENVFWKWETLDKADIVDDFLFFTLFTHKLYLIPLKSFSSDNESINFLGVIKSNILRFKGESNPRKIKNLYYWGLVGFIPNFGVIAGIILIVKGFNYSNSKLILIGVADVIFTFVFWILIAPQILP